MMDNADYLKLVKWRVLNEIKRKLSEIKNNDELYITDIICDALDSSIPGRSEAIDLIDYLTEHEGIREDYIDKGLLDTSSLDRFVSTLCYAMLEEYIFNDDFINSLQRIDGDKISDATAQKWIKKIDKEMKKYEPKKDLATQRIYMDTENQIWIKKNFELSADDFKEPYFVKDQIVELHNAIKILTNPYKEGMTYEDFILKHMNKNALVIEHPERDICRIYLMHKSPNLDIRKLFKIIPRSIREANYDLNPETYIEGKLHKKFTDKFEFIRTIAKVVNELVVKQARGEI